MNETSHLNSEDEFIEYAARMYKGIQGFSDLLQRKRQIEATLSGKWSPPSDVQEQLRTLIGPDHERFGSEGSSLRELIWRLQALIKKYEHVQDALTERLEARITHFRENTPEYYYCMHLKRDKSLFFDVEKNINEYLEDLLKTLKGEIEAIKESNWTRYHEYVHRETSQFESLYRETRRIEEIYSIRNVLARWLKALAAEELKSPTRRKN